MHHREHLRFEAGKTADGLGGWSRERSGMKHLLRIGRPDCSFHKLRHSSVSSMINVGVPLYTVGKVLGNKDPRSTARYSHLADDTIRDAVARIGQKVPHHG